MKIYTKKGDDGTTSLIGGVRVSKASLRIEAYGTVDELNSWIGVLRSNNIENDTIEKGTEESLLEIQDRLFTMGSLLAVAKEGTKMELPKIYEKDVLFLESEIDKMEEKLEPMKHFVLPGGNNLVSFCHVARCVCRRAERICIDLAASEAVNPLIIQYLNRLSDFLFVLSRKWTSDFKIEEKSWKPKI